MLNAARGLARIGHVKALSDVWDDIHRVRHRSKRIDSHPRQMPIHLIERLLLLTTDEGDAALDPFCGGGAAAKRLGRAYIGTDIDLGYRAAARERMELANPVTVNGACASAFRGKAVSVRDIDIKKPAAETPSGTGAA